RGKGVGQRRRVCARQAFQVALVQDYLTFAERERLAEICEQELLALPPMHAALRRRRLIEFFKQGRCLGRLSSSESHPRLVVERFSERTLGRDGRVAKAGCKSRAEGGERVVREGWR